jgi:hypothetical protein
MVRNRFMPQEDADRLVGELERVRNLFR